MGSSKLASGRLPRHLAYAKPGGTHLTPIHPCNAIPCTTVLVPLHAQYYTLRISWSGWPVHLSVLAASTACGPASTFILFVHPRIVSMITAKQTSTAVVSGGFGPVEQHSRVVQYTQTPQRGWLTSVVFSGMRLACNPPIHFQGCFGYRSV